MLELQALKTQKDASIDITPVSAMPFQVLTGKLVQHSYGLPVQIAAKQYTFLKGALRRDAAL